MASRIIVAAAIASLALAGCASTPKPRTLDDELLTQEALTQGLAPSDDFEKIVRDAFSSTGQDLNLTGLVDAGLEVRQQAGKAGIDSAVIWKCIPTYGGSLVAAAQLCADKASDPLSNVADLPIGSSAPGLCLAAMETASASASPNIKATLRECKTVEEWGYALSLHPGAMGLRPSAKLKVIEIQSACLEAASAPVCVNAAGRGLL